MGTLDTSASLSPPPAALQLDTDTLARYLQRALPDAFIPGQGQPRLEALQFSHGQVCDSAAGSAFFTPLYW